VCNACGFRCCASDVLGGCGCDCDEPGCRQVTCEFCGEEYDVIYDDHECPPRCPECGRFVKLYKSYQDGIFLTYWCRKCQKEFGEDELLEEE